MDIEKSPSRNAKVSSMRTFRLASFGAGFMVICLLFIIAFIGFQPDQYSLSDLYFPSPTITLTRTPTPTPTATLTPTPTLTSTPNWTATQKIIEATGTAQVIQTIVAEAGNEWNVLLSDPFDSNENSWYEGTADDDYSTIIYKINAGKYQWDASSKKGFIVWTTADSQSLTDFYLSVDVQLIKGIYFSDYGVIFRKDVANNFYYLGMDNNQYFVSLNYNDEWTDIIDRKFSATILPNQANKVTVIARGTHFIILINDQFVAEFDDEQIKQGRVGMAIEMHAPSLQTVIEFDNFELWEP